MLQVSSVVEDRVSYLLPSTGLLRMMGCRSFMSLIYPCPKMKNVTEVIMPTRQTFTVSLIGSGTSPNHHLGQTRRYRCDKLALKATFSWTTGNVAYRKLTRLAPAQICNPIFSFTQMCSRPVSHRGLGSICFFSGVCRSRVVNRTVTLPKNS